MLWQFASGHPVLFNSQTPVERSIKARALKGLSSFLSLQLMVYDNFIRSSSNAQKTLHETTRTNTKRLFVWLRVVSCLFVE